MKFIIQITFTSNMNNYQLIFVEENNEIRLQKKISDMWMSDSSKSTCFYKEFKWNWKERAYVCT